MWTRGSSHFPTLSVYWRRIASILSDVLRGFSGGQRTLLVHWVLGTRSQYPHTGGLFDSTSYTVSYSRTNAVSVNCLNTQVLELYVRIYALPRIRSYLILDCSQGSLVVISHGSEYRSKWHRCWAGWYDPRFGLRDDILDHHFMWEGTFHETNVHENACSLGL